MSFFHLFLFKMPDFLSIIIILFHFDNFTLSPNNRKETPAASGNSAKFLQLQATFTVAGLVRVAFII